MTRPGTWIDSQNLCGFQCCVLLSDFCQLCLYRRFLFRFFQIIIPLALFDADRPFRIVVRQILITGRWMPFQPQTPQAVFYHVVNNPVRREKLGGGRDVLLADLDVLFQIGEYLVFRLGVIILVQPADNLHLILPIFLWNQVDHLLDGTAFAQQIIRQKKLGIVRNLLEHAGQNAIQGVALNNEQVLEKFLFLIVSLQLVDLCHVQTIQLHVNRLGQNLRTESPLVIRKHADMRGQIPIDLHETQGSKSVKPCIGDFFHNRFVALFLDTTDQGLPLPFLGFRKQMTIYTVGIIVAAALVGDAVHRSAFRHAVNQFSPCPHSIFLDSILIHTITPYSMMAVSSMGDICNVIG